MAVVLAMASRAFQRLAVAFLSESSRWAWLLVYVLPPGRMESLENGNQTKERSLKNAYSHMHVHVCVPRVYRKGDHPCPLEGAMKLCSS